MVGNRTGVGAKVHDAIAASGTTDIKPDDIDIIATGTPGSGTVRRGDLCCPFDIRDKGNPRLRSATGADSDRASIGAWEDVYDRARRNNSCRFLDGGKGLIQRTIIRVVSAGGDVIVRSSRRDVELWVWESNCGTG